jgi:uracil-DNA glycosylase family 4
VTLVDINIELLSCRRCPRLVEWREKMARVKRRAYREWEYWGKPVPGFGDPQGAVFVVGLAPGAHGSNRTGRQFTGDASGDFLYPALFRSGFASQPHSSSIQDGLILNNLYTAPVCRCAPPNNRPSAEEISNCLPYLETELEIIKPKVIVALGRVVYDAILRILTKNKAKLGKPFNHSSIHFFHNAIIQLDLDHWLLASYHPSRQKYTDWTPDRGNV